jgi:high-affinity nickel permease
MLGLDEQLAHLGHGEAFAVVALIAVLLGIRHATDPDHLTAVTTLVAGERPGARRAGQLGLDWGLGHATSLLALGVPIVLYGAYLPGDAQTGAEAAVGVLIMALAVRLLVRWSRGDLRHPGSRPARSPLQAYGIGLLHGVGGSAGVGVLLLAAIPGHAAALAALGLFSVFSAAGMGLASTTFGLVLCRGPAVRGQLAALAPALGTLSLAFGLWYALGALGAMPYGL